MDGWEKDFELYVQRYATSHCNGDIELAKQHKIVEEVRQYYKATANQRDEDKTF